MTKEEYMQKLMSQFEDEETLIPETKDTTDQVEQTEQEDPKETQRLQESTEVEGVSETDDSKTEGSEANLGVSDEGANQKSGSEGETSTDDEPINPENGKKYSNKKIKKTIWENKHLAKELAEVKRQLEEMRAASAARSEKKQLSAPVRSQFSSDEEYTNAAFAYNLQLLAEKNRAQTEEQMKVARFMEEKQRLYDEKIKDCIPEAKFEEFDSLMSENFADLQQTLTMDAQNDIVSMSTTPLILWKLAQSPDLISTVNRMNSVERIMFCNKIAEQMSKELAEPAPVVQKKAPVVGKVGTGKTAGRNIEEMTPEEMYAMYAKRLSGG